MPSSSFSSSSRRASIGSRAQIAPVEPQQIERREPQQRGLLRLARQPRLERLERRTPLLVDHARLAVDDALARRQLRGGLRDGAEAIRPVVALARVQPHLVAGLAREEAIAVVFDLEQPRRRIGDRRRGGRQHRLAHRGEQRSRALPRLRRAHATRSTRALPTADDGLGSLGDDVVRGVGVPVLRLEEEPRPLAGSPRAVVAARALGPDQVPVAHELLAEEADVKVPLVEHLALRARRHRLERPAVPDEHVARAVLLLRDAPLEVVVGHGVVLGLDREALHAGVVAGALRDRPACHCPLDFQAEVVVQAARVVLLHHEHPGRFLYGSDRLLRRSLVPFRLGCDVEAALGLVGGQASRRCVGRHFAVCFLDLLLCCLLRSPLRPSHRSIPCARSGPVRLRSAW